jgi:ribosomal protein L35
VLRRKAMQSHNLEKKSPKRKRAYTRDQPVHESDVKDVKKLLGGQ